MTYPTQAEIEKKEKELEELYWCDPANITEAIEEMGDGEDIMLAFSHGLHADAGFEIFFRLREYAKTWRERKLVDWIDSYGDSKTLTKAEKKWEEARDAA